MNRLSTLDRPLLAALVLAAAIGVPGAALAQAKDGAAPLKFPASTDHATLGAWLKLETDIPPETVVAISPLALVAITKTQPMVTPEGFEVTLRAETLDGAFSQKEGLASWQATMKLACKDQTFSMGEVTGYGARNLKGQGKPIQTAIVGWKPVTPGTMQGEIWSARCGKDFTPPLAPVAAQTRAAAPQAKAPAPTAPAAAAPASPKPPPAAPSPVAKPPAPLAVPETKAAATPSAKPLAATPPAAPVAKPPAPPPAPTPKPVEAGPIAAIAAPAPKSAPAPVRGGKSAQILSAPTSAEAQHAIDRLKAKLGAAMSGLTAEVVPAQVKGKPTYRAIVSGFKSPGDAGLFCQKVEAAGGKCLVRADNGHTP